MINFHLLVISAMGYFVPDEYTYTDACSNDFGAISKVEGEDVIAGGRRTDVRSDFEEDDRLITTFGSDPELVSVLGGNAGTDEESVVYHFLF